jgi:hypothetical protein
MQVHSTDFLTLFFSFFAEFSSNGNIENNAELNTENNAELSTDIIVESNTENNAESNTKTNVEYICQTWLDTPEMPNELKQKFEKSETETNSLMIKVNQSVEFWKTKNRRKRKRNSSEKGLEF